MRSRLPNWPRRESRKSRPRFSRVIRSSGSRGWQPVHSLSLARQRNPTALFGLGLIDAIRDDVIEAMANREANESPETQGRVSRLKDGRIGRLGWKGQVASVEDFVLNACAVELGLEVPGTSPIHEPAGSPLPGAGLDLTAEQCSHSRPM